MPKNFWRNLKKPIVCLAPMDGYTDTAFRRICKKVNPNIIVFTEFTSADGIFHNAKKVKEKLNFDPSEQPIIAQIFGKDEKTFLAATKVCEEMGFAGIDLNMGCPAKKVVKSEHGIALRKKPDQAFRLVETVAQNTKLPVSVKTRLGWNDAGDLIDFGKGVENAGADLIIIHGRTYTVPYNCEANFEPIYELKRNIKIPVIGNGGIASIQDGLDKLDNLDGFMIGRASFGNPWIFSPVIKNLTFAQKLPIIKDHINYLVESKGQNRAMFEIRKHLVAYVKSFPGASEFRASLVRVENPQQAFEILEKIAKI
ncbi:MAG: tRNA-dihydrouridine synthase [Candidatus Buchananbacteria bacterium]|nr:tRNA-dihydrouridine synthase [Candidatus Buchananbacteria bacterium]